jgi:hypothetical protein
VGREVQNFWVSHPSSTLTRNCRKRFSGDFQVLVNVPLVINPQSVVSFASRNLNQ